MKERKELIKLMRKYFMEDVEIKITGESSLDYKVEFTIDMEGFYIRTSFMAIKERIEDWKKGIGKCQHRVE